jgi:hypothetical protein
MPDNKNSMKNRNKGPFSANFLFAIFILLLAFNYAKQSYSGPPNAFLEKAWKNGESERSTATTRLVQPEADQFDKSHPLDKDRSSSRPELSLTQSVKNQSAFEEFLYCLPNVRTCFDEFGANNEQWYRVIRAFGTTILNIFQLFITLIVSGVSWLITTHLLTKGVQFSNHIFITTRPSSNSKFYRIAFRNDGRGKLPTEWQNRLFKIFDVQLYGIIEIPLQSCQPAQVQAGSDEELVADEKGRTEPDIKKNKATTTFELELTEKFHAVMEPDRKRLVTIGFKDREKVYRRLASILCKCGETTCKVAENKAALNDLWQKSQLLPVKERYLDILQIMKIYDGAGVEVVALVAGVTSLRKKPHESHRYTAEDFKPIALFNAKNAKYDSYH